MNSLPTRPTPVTATAMVRGVDETVAFVVDELMGAVEREPGVSPPYRMQGTGWSKSLAFISTVTRGLLTRFRKNCEPVVGVVRQWKLRVLLSTGNSFASVRQVRNNARFRKLE